MPDQNVDVCIAGAGPAGLTLALLLLRSGLRVAVVERSRSFDRDYRGEILQPGAMSLLDRLGVLAGARSRGCHEHSRFRVIDQGRALLDIDYRRLPGPYNCLLSIPQRHVLEEMATHCARYDGFDYHSGAKVTGLLRDGDRIAGVQTSAAAADTIRARCVVAADGRYSKVRRLAGIAVTRLDVFDYDVLWLRLPADGIPVDDVQVFRADGAPVLIYTSVPDSIQLGWTLPHKGYRALAERGVEHVKAEMIRALPARFADPLRRQVTRLADLTLLDVFSGSADSWASDGLVLIGDSAHTHSPIGAQGINLAIQDAIALHPILVGALRAGDLSVSSLSRFEAARRPDIRRVFRLQRIQSKAMLSRGTIAARLRPMVMRLVARTPIHRAVLHQIAYGNKTIQPSGAGAAGPEHSTSHLSGNQAT